MITYEYLFFIVQVKGIANTTRPTVQHTNGVSRCTSTPHDPFRAHISSNVGHRSAVPKVITGAPSGAEALTFSSLPALLGDGVNAGAGPTLTGPSVRVDKAADLAVKNPYWNPRPIERERIRELIRRAWAGEPASADL